MTHPHQDELEPIAVVVNNNRRNSEHIVEPTKANVTLDIGTELFTREQLTTKVQEAVQAFADDIVKTHKETRLLRTSVPEIVSKALTRVEGGE